MGYYVVRYYGVYYTGIKIAGMTLTPATEKFNNDTLEDKKQVLSALGSNGAKRHPYPILADGRLSLEEYFWLQPIKKGKL